MMLLHLLQRGAHFVPVYVSAIYTETLEDCKTYNYCY